MALFRFVVFVSCLLCRCNDKFSSLCTYNEPGVPLRRVGYGCVSLFERVCTCACVRLWESVVAWRAVPVHFQAYSCVPLFVLCGQL
eukprot:m.28424 g.28424  ORF g.28424 m.28424 type:complete len:86 (-) comp8833_c0_seq1:208-465(-)